jgi:hypothetical protein
VELLDRADRGAGGVGCLRRLREGEVVLTAPRSVSRARRVEQLTAS